MRLQNTMMFPYLLTLVVVFFQIYQLLLPVCQYRLQNQQTYLEIYKYIFRTITVNFRQPKPILIKALTILSHLQSI